MCRQVWLFPLGPSATDHDKPVDLELVITGRGAAPRIIDAADLVTEMKESTLLEKESAPGSESRNSGWFRAIRLIELFRSAGLQLLGPGVL